MTDACSRYRGGYYHPENETLTADLLSRMSEGKATGNQPFFFLGNRSDLSVFWQVTRPETKGPLKTFPEERVLVPKDMLEHIPDKAIRNRSIAVFAKAQAEGLVGFDGRSYFITESGKHFISKTDFVLSRLEAEYKFFTSAQTVLEKEAAKETQTKKEAWIDARLKERGINPKQYEGCQRITIDRASLYVERQGQNWVSNVPGTARRQKVILPGDHVVEVDEKTLIAFIDPGKVYSGMGSKSSLPGSELMKRFVDKTEDLPRHPSTEAIQKAATSPGSSSFNRDDFFDAAVRDSLKRHGKLPDKKAVLNPKLKIGDTVFAPDLYKNSLKLHEYKIIRLLTDTCGQFLYKLAGEGVPDQLVPEGALDKFLFTDQEQGASYLTAHSEEAASYADELLARTMGKQFEGAPEVQEISVHTLTLDKNCLISGNGESCQIRFSNKQVEQLVVPTKDVLQEGEHLQVTLRSDQSYKVLTGAYSYNVSGDGAAKMSGVAVQTAKQSVQASVGAASQTVGNTAATATATAATATAQTAVHTAVASVPIPEPITMTAKSIYAAAAQVATSVAQTTAQTVAPSALKLTQTIGKEG